MKKLIVYDLDGTLVDTGKDIARAANAMRESLGLGELPDQEIFQFIGRGLYPLVSGCLETQDPKKIEKQLMDSLPEKDWGEAGMAISFLGREICRPTNPKCEECVMKGVCGYYKSLK